MKGPEALQYFEALDTPALHRELRARERRLGADPQLVSIDTEAVLERFSTLLQATCGMTNTFDLFALPGGSPPLKPLAPAVGILIPDVSLVCLKEPETARYLLNGLHGAISDVLCPDEPFWSQPAVAQVGGGASHPDVQRANSGTVFLIQPGIAITAAHCLNVAAQRLRVLFDFEMFDAVNPRITFPKSMVYEVVDYVRDPAIDVAVIKLDRNVENPKLLALDPAVQVDPGDALSALGFPLGLPKKATLGGAVTTVTEELIIARLGAYGGSSGSPVFDAAQKVVGMVSKGPVDSPFQKHGACYRLLPCPGPNFEGIQVVTTQAICESTTISQAIADFA